MYQAYLGVALSGFWKEEEVRGGKRREEEGRGGKRREEGGRGGKSGEEEGRRGRREGGKEGRREGGLKAPPRTISNLRRLAGTSGDRRDSRDRGRRLLFAC